MDKKDKKDKEEKVSNYSELNHSVGMSSIPISDGAPWISLGIWGQMLLATNWN